MSSSSSSSSRSLSANDLSGGGGGHIRGLAFQPALIDGTDFQALHQVDGRKYPTLRRALDDSRKNHLARAVKQQPITRMRPGLLHSLRPQLDASIDHGLQGGCGFVAVLLPEAPAQQVVGNLRSVECGTSLYKIVLKSRRDGPPAQLHEEARRLVQRMFEHASEHAIERTAASPTNGTNVNGENLDDLDNGPSALGTSMMRPLQKAGPGKDEYSPPPDQRICSWADKPSVRQHLETTTSRRMFREGLYVPPLQSGYTDGPSCRFCLYSFDDRPRENEFIFGLMVDGGSALGNIVLRNACLHRPHKGEESSPPSPSIESLRPAFESVREYSDMARDAQAFVLLAWMLQAFDEDERWSISLPPSKFLEADERRVYFSESFVVNHYNCLVPMADAVGATGSMCPPDALKLYKSLLARANGSVRPSGDFSKSEKSGNFQTVEMVPPSAGSGSGLPLGEWDVQGKGRLREMLMQKRKTHAISAGETPAAQPSSIPPGHPLYQRLHGTGGVRLPGPSSSASAPAMGHRGMLPGDVPPGSLGFFQQCTSAAASCGGLLIQSQRTQRACLVLSSFKVGTREPYDVVKSDRDSELVRSGVYSSDKRCDFLPNLDLLHVHGAFPRFLPDAGGNLAREALDRAFPPAPGGENNDDLRILQETTAYLSDHPFMQQVVNRADKVCSFVQTYSMTCLAMYCDTCQDSELQRRERTPWARALYEHLSEDCDDDHLLRSETLDRREFLRASMEHTCLKAGPRSDFFPFDHYVVSTSPDFLTEVVQNRLPSARIPPPGHFQNSTVQTERPIRECILQHFRDGTPLPVPLWDVLGDETLHRVRIMPDLLNLDSLHAALANWEP